MIKFKLYLFLFIGSMQAKDVCVLVHGTWSHKNSWHKPGDLFYKTLQRYMGEVGINLVSFTWGGELSYEKRAIAGEQLADLVSSYSPETKFYILAHSHGSNVAIIASQILGKQKQKNKIKCFYSLGAPIDLDSYMPDMSVINNFYNLFSFGDIVQPVLCMYSRTFPQHERICNLEVTIEGKEPQHEELHCYEVARWIVHLHGLARDFDFKNNLMAYFSRALPPSIMIDFDRNIKIKHDDNFHEAVCMHLLRKKQVVNKYQPGRVSFFVTPY